MGISYGMGKSDNATTLSTPDYQQWAAYPESPVLTADYPYQFVGYEQNLYYKLYASATSFYYTRTASSSVYFDNNTGVIIKRWLYSASIWSAQSNLTGEGAVQNGGGFIEANNDIYTDSSRTTVYFAKTTP